ncbi:MAG: papain-like cysteine protease family protein [bacterium]
MTEILSKMGFGDFYNLAKTYGNGRPLKRIFSLVEKEGCTEIRKSEVEDCREWNAEWEIYYQHLNISKKALKFDFYTAKQEYLGYLILRPSDGTICDSFIHTPTKRIETSNYFITCKNSLCEIDGIHFIQQDVKTGRCAHACLAMVSKNLSYKTKKTPLTFREIRELSGNTSIPASGLNINEITDVIKGMGYYSRCYDYLSEDIPYEPDEIIYQYIESQIPVYVGLRFDDGGHAIIVIGHTFDSNAWWPEAKLGYYKHEKRFYFKSPIFTDFVIQDDNFGPYLTSPRNFFTRENISKVIVPLIENFPLYAEEIEDYIVYSFLADFKFHKQMKLNKTIWTDVYLHHLTEDKILLRTFLIERDEFIKSIRKSNAPQDIKTFYTNPVLFPKMTSDISKFWLIEISIPEIFIHKHYRLGEVLINPYEEDWLKAILSIHLPGVLFAKNPEGRLEEYLINNDVPYEIARFPS